MAGGPARCRYDDRLKAVLAFVRPMILPCESCRLPPHALCSVHFLFKPSAARPNYLHSLLAIRYSRIANVEWDHGVEASGRLRGAEACRGRVAAGSLFLPRT